MFKKRFKDRLILQHQTGLYRNPPEIKSKDGKHIVIGNKRVLNFSSNDYLGLSVSEQLKKKVSHNFLKYNTSSSSSRLVSGNYSTVNQAEKAYARYFGYEDALFFPSGYQANIAILSTLFEPEDTLIFDKHIHASSVKGMVSSGAAFKGYNHSSMKHLLKRLEANRGKKAAVMTESLFSMDGDLLNLETFGKLKKQYDFLSIVDEAHAFGAIGENGKGIAREVADIGVGTFGKALGLFGAFVLLPRVIKEYLFNFASPLIYTTTLPEAHAASAIDLLEIIDQCDDRRYNLRRMSQLMKEGLITEGFHVRGGAHILAIEIGDEKRSVDISRHLMENGFFVLPARYPTVPLQRAILRVGMSALHNEGDVNDFINILKEAKRTVE